MIKTISDSNRITFGKYKGSKFKNIPFSYLKWIYDNNTCPKNVIFYINNLIHKKEELTLINKIKEKYEKNNNYDSSDTIFKQL
jgi:uncharacterized protein (DUF3820 family)